MSIASDILFAQCIVILLCSATPFSIGSIRMCYSSIMTRHWRRHSSTYFSACFLIQFELSQRQWRNCVAQCAEADPYGSTVTVFLHKRRMLWHCFELGRYYQCMLAHDWGLVTCRSHRSWSCSTFLAQEAALAECSSFDKHTSPRMLSRSANSACTVHPAMASLAWCFRYLQFV